MSAMIKTYTIQLHGSQLLLVHTPTKINFNCLINKKIFLQLQLYFGKSITQKHSAFGLSQFVSNSELTQVDKLMLVDLAIV